MSETDAQISYATNFGPLLEVLASARRPGSWYASGGLETAMPAIEVDGVGRLSFPVPISQAKELIEDAGERAPYGKGDKTLVDESVRRVWQISPAKVKMSGKGWAATMEELVRKVGEDLGCEGIAIEAQFYKLLVYEKGGFFLSHRDSEKTGGMFGTLVVSLPSPHEGGELIVRHAGREATLHLCGEGAPSEIQYAAFYADCEHEVRPVTSGYRVCLVYNLVRKIGRESITPPDHRNAIAAAAPLLAQWASSSEKPDKIVYLLDHHYTQAALSFSALKGADAALAQVLLAAAAQTGCAAHLGIVHIEESGWAEHSGGGGYRRYYHEQSDEDYEVGEVCDATYYIDQWCAPGDQPVEFGQIPIGDGEVLPPGALDGEEPDDSHFSEATGNEGASFERTYLRAALIIWPENRFDSICGSAGAEAAIARLEGLVVAAIKASKANREEAQNAVHRFTGALPAVADWTGERDKLVSRLLDTLRIFGDADLLLKVCERPLLEFYNGSQNRELLGAVPVLGEKRATALLGAVIHKFGPLAPNSVFRLWISVAENFAKYRALLDGTLDTLLEAIARFSLCAKPAFGSFSLFSKTRVVTSLEEDGGTSLSSKTAAALLSALHASPCAGRMGELISAIVEKPELFAPESILLPALKTVVVPVANGPDELWAHCAAHYLKRSERPPEPPQDWAQNVTLSGNSPLIRELEAFARDPQEQVHRFRARMDLRLEVEAAIKRAGLDMTHFTERKGSPQTLVCTKTRATYERARKQYERSCRHASLARSSFGANEE